jgi:hypothetical protein
VVATRVKHSFCADEKNGEGTWAKGLTDASSEDGAGGPGSSCWYRSP